MCALVARNPRIESAMSAAHCRKSHPGAKQALMATVVSRDCQVMPRPMASTAWLLAFTAWAACSIEIYLSGETFTHFSRDLDECGFEVYNIILH